MHNTQVSIHTAHNTISSTLTNCPAQSQPKHSLHVNLFQPVENIILLMKTCPAYTHKQEGTIAQGRRSARLMVRLINIHED